MVQSRSGFLTVFPDAFRTHNQNRNQHVSRNICSLSLIPLFLCMNLQCSWMLETISCGADLLSQFVLVRPQTIEAESILHHETYVYFACLRVCDANAVCVPGSRVTPSSRFQYVHVLWFCAVFFVFPVVVKLFVFLPLLFAVSDEISFISLNSGYAAPFTLSLNECVRDVIEYGFLVHLF